PVFTVDLSLHRHPPHPPLFPYTTLFRSCHPLASRLHWIAFGPVVPRVEFEPTSHNSGHRSNKAGQGISTSQTPDGDDQTWVLVQDRKSTRLNSSHLVISYAVFCLKKKSN